MSDDKLTFASIAGLKICVNDALPPDTAVFLRGDQVTRIVHLERDARVAAFREGSEILKTQAARKGGEDKSEPYWADLVRSGLLIGADMLRARADELEKEEK